MSTGPQHPDHGATIAASDLPPTASAASSSDPQVHTDHLRLACEICGSPALPFGEKWGTWRDKTYRFRHCPSCHFSFVENPDTDFAAIYNADYYAGRGADPLIDYDFEISHPDATIRRYEWAGVTEVVRTIAGLGKDTVWLDFGCGNGGLVKWVAERHGVTAYGYDTGSMVESNRNRGIRMVADDELSALRSSCDVVTAIEVLEHISDPLDALGRIHQLLKPGGLFFFTTGNAKPHRDRFHAWSYVRPEIHISYYEPETMDRALRKSGFEPEYHGFVSGFTGIVTYKVLKVLRVKRRSPLMTLVPWTALARVVDARHGVSHFPVGRRQT